MLTYSTFDRDGFLADPDNFIVDIPLVKAGDADDEHWIVQGIASCEVKDAEGERIIQKGIDCDPLMKSGYINWDHRDKEGPAYLIGYPIEFRLVNAVDYKQQLGKSVDGMALWVKGELYKNKQKARDVWEHIQATSGTPRQLGWSVQGRVVDRDAREKSRITKSQVHHLAITHQPVNQCTFAEMAKSFATVMTTQSAQPLMLENLDGKLTSVLWGTCKKGCYNNKGRFVKGRRGALEHLSECHGEPLPDSVNLIKSLISRGFQL